MKKLLLLPALCLLLFMPNSFGQGSCYAFYNYNINSYNPPVIAFTNSAFDSLGTVTSYLWDFGDGQTSTNPNPVHTYSANGAYTVCLIIGTSSACIDTQCYYINATPSVNVVLVGDSAHPFFCSAPASAELSFSAHFVSFSPPDSTQFHIFFGDGLDSIFYRLNNSTYMYGTFTHIYQNMGTFYPSIIVTAPTGLADTSSALPIIVTNSCGNITGVTYYDVNGNCIYDAGDSVAGNHPVYISSNSNFLSSTLSDASGNYFFNVPPGPTYQLEIPSYYGHAAHASVTCPLSGTYTVTTIPSSGNDFGLSCPPAFDLHVSINASCLRPGFTRSVYISAFNSSCVTPSGQIQVIFPPDLTPLPDSANSYNITGNTVSFPINAPELSWQRNIPVLVSASAVIGATECVGITATPLIGDADTTNNSETDCTQIAGSWDPNLKLVEPAGIGAQGLIAPSTDLNYTIDFQNTGTAEAINIFILDTIDSNLDLSSLRIMGESHPMTWSIQANRVIRFSFDNINLPDSNSNELYSHGYVSYKISQLPNLPQHTAIENTAAIYFDFNSPVITNTTINTIDNTLSIQDVRENADFEMYPNPVHDNLTIKFKNADTHIVRVFDYSGRLVIIKETSNELLLDLSKLGNGFYSVQVSNEKSVSISKIIIQK